MIDIVAHIEPNYFKNRVEIIATQKNLDSKKLHKYYSLIWGIQDAYKKTTRYCVYFADFYPNTDNIPNYEALEHHVHSYLNDLIILQNKLVTFLGDLKNDLKRISGNKYEVGKDLKEIIEGVSSVFDNVSIHRNPHQHRGLKYMDSDILESERAANALRKNHPFSSLLTLEQKDSLKEKELKFFEKAQNYRIQQAQKNDKQILGLLDDLFQGLEKTIYDLLGIKTIV